MHCIMPSDLFFQILPKFSIPQLVHCKSKPVLLLFLEHVASLKNKLAASNLSVKKNIYYREYRFKSGLA